MNWATLEPWILTCLNCADISELPPSPSGVPWTEEELFNYAAEALADIGGRFLLVVEYDDSIQLVAGQRNYGLDPLHIATIYAAANGETLRPSTVAEVEALDDGWSLAANGTPVRWIGNILGLHLIAVYPPPAGYGKLNLIYQKRPPDLTPAAPDVPMPAPIGDYLVTRTLEGARSRQGELEMPDVAAALGQLAQVYEGALQQYYGKKGAI